MAFGGLRGTLVVNATSITNPTIATGSVAVQVDDLVVCLLVQQTALTVTGVTSSFVTTYTALNAGTDAGNVTCRPFYGLVTSAGTLTAVNFACTASANNVAAMVAVIEGPFASAPLDKNLANITSDITSPFTCPATGTLTQADEFVIAWGAADYGTAWTSTSPNIELVEQASAALIKGTIGGQVVSATTTVTPVFAAASNPGQAILGTASFMKAAAPEETEMPGVVMEWGVQPWPKKIAITWAPGLSRALSAPPPAETHVPGGVIDWGLQPPPLRIARTWLQGTAPIITPPLRPFQQYNWPVPKPPSRIARTWLLSSVATITPVEEPFSQHDWPVPRRAVRLNTSWNYQSYPLVKVELLPKNQYAWPVPLQVSQVAITWTQRPYPLYAEPMPVNEYNWPVPRRAARLDVGFTLQPFNLLEAVEAPFFQTDWPVPRAKDRLSVSFARQPYNLFVAPEPPFITTDWPVPLRPARTNFSWSFQSYPLATVEPLPFNQSDWPLPRRVDRVAVTWLQRPYPLYAEDLPINQYSWPVPRAKDRLTVSWVQASNTDLLITEVPTPFYQHDWPLPAIAFHPSSLRTWIQSTPILITSLEEQPLNQHVWPVPRPAIYPNSLLTWSQSKNPEIPIKTHDWPVPRPAVYPNSLLTWAQSTPILITSLEDRPAFNYDWPLPRTKAKLDVGFVLGSTIRLEPIVEELPRNQYNWPVPQRADRAVDQRQGSINIAFMVAETVPFGSAQPLPRIAPFPAALRTWLNFARLEERKPPSTPIVDPQRRAFRMASQPRGTPTHQIATGVMRFGRADNLIRIPRIVPDPRLGTPATILAELAAAVPLNQHDWPRLVQKSRLRYEGWQRSSIALLTFVAPALPKNQYYWPLPTAARAAEIQGQQSSNYALVTTPIEARPPPAYSYPVNPAFYPFLAVGWAQSTPIALASQPDPTKTFFGRRRIPGLEWQPWDRANEPRGYPY